MKYVALVFAATACGGGDSKPAVTTNDAMIDAPINTTTALTAAMLNTRTLDHAIYGVNNDDGTLHVEVHKGGDPGCPTMTSPTPDYTAIIGRVPPMTAATATSVANFLDYQGDMLGGATLGAAATMVSLTSVVYTVGISVALDVSLTFAAGTVTGHVFATHCDSLDG